MLYRREELGLHLVIVKLAVKSFSVSVASSTIEKETILSDRYFKPPYAVKGLNIASMSKNEVKKKVNQNLIAA